MLRQTHGLERPNPNPCFCDLLITFLHPYSPAYARVAEVSHIEEAATAASALEPREGKGIGALMSVLVCFGLSPGTSGESSSAFFPGRAFDLLLLKEF